MTRRLLPLALVLALVGCDDEPDLPENPPYAVPGQTVPENPPMPSPGMAMPTAGAPQTDFTPPLAVPGYATLPDPPMPQMPPGMQPTGAPVPLATGFQPDPVVLSGVSGGPVAAAEIAPGQPCVGYLPAQPSHLLQLQTYFANLRILVNSGQDTTLVIRGPDGSFRCNDDANPQDLNPIVEGPFPAGVYQVFVGTYQPSIQAPYAIGFTELPQVTAAMLAPQGGGMQPGSMQPMQPMR